MTQQVVHARITLPQVNTLEDQASIGLTIEATGSNTTLDLPGIIDPALIGYINGPVTGMTNPLAYYLSPDISRATNAVQITYTDVTAHLDGSPAGSPVHVSSFTLGAAASAAGLPTQVAACVGYRAPYGSDVERGTTATLPSTDAAIDQGAPSTHSGVTRPRARDRGRIYLGPLNKVCSHNLQVASGSVNLLDSAFVTDLTAWCHAVFLTHLSGDPNQWNVVNWSRRAARVQSVGFFYVDEGFSIIRRRGDTTEARAHNWVAV